MTACTCATCSSSRRGRPLGVTGGPGADDSGLVLAQLLELERGAGGSGIVDLTEELKRREQERKREQARQKAAACAALGTPSRRSRRVLVIPKLLAYGAVAAVVLGMLSLVYVSGVGRPAVSDPAAENAAAENPAAETTPRPTAVQPPVVAELVSSDGLVWGLSTRPGTPLRKGALVIDAGIARVRFQDGALATFRGPAVIELRGGNRMALHPGRDGCAGARAGLRLHGRYAHDARRRPGHGVRRHGRGGRRQRGAGVYRGGHGRGV